MTSDKVLIHEENKILRITINRPDVRNALDRETYALLAQTIDATVDRDDLHAIIITGAANYFTAGNDLHDFQKTPEAVSPAMVFLESLNKATIPIIAAVEGGAVGIGVTMLLHCDFVYAGKDTRFQLPFIHLALCPEGASSVLLAQYVGIRQANEWLFRGNPFSAEKAFEAGLINQVSESGQAIHDAQKLAEELTQHSLASLKHTKRLLKRQISPVVAETIHIERKAFAECLQSEAAQEKFRKFFANKK
ncbi:enoyl-CoA hydratase-related protein [Pelistega suis]|uniref:enoyl-CoA hydratase-related protein n=1 Tax=Pelistega suis TaxID=1631957 RepID=UPI00211BC47D|nr:enoyl-CoA hydratase-related protein [Pelistega suis]MCQ9329235.1 enoyl-CoA hydratase-related protein [Pelistega suis]